MNDSEEAPNRAAASLAAENARLRAKLDEMTLMARLNQEKMRRFDALENKIIGAPSVFALLSTLLHDYKAEFALDAVSLALLDLDSELDKLLDQERNGAVFAEGLLLLDRSEPLRNALNGQSKPVLSQCSESARFLFDGQAAGLVSVALLPLVLRGHLMGSLNLGSTNPERFVNSSGTDFLERLAVITALCLDGALATERLKLAGLTDAMTGVNNRRYFESRCVEEVSAAIRKRAPLACLFLDVDKFKSLNDTYGHQVGDEVLRFVASLIKIQLRGSDLLSRYGGEEFVALLPGTTQEAALATAERIRRVIAAQSAPIDAPQSVHLSISIGVSMLEVPAGKLLPDALAHLASDMVARADKAVYRAKAAGRNRVEIG